MPALTAGRIELELNAAPPRQTAELTQQFVAGHGRWMAFDQKGVKSAPLAGEDGNLD